MSSDQSDWLRMGSRNSHLHPPESPYLQPRHCAVQAWWRRGQRAPAGAPSQVLTQGVRLQSSTHCAAASQAGSQSPAQHSAGYSCKSPPGCCPNAPEIHHISCLTCGLVTDSQMTAIWTTATSRASCRAPPIFCARCASSSGVLELGSPAYRKTRSCRLALESSSHRSAQPPGPGSQKLANGCCQPAVQPLACGIAYNVATMSDLVPTCLGCIVLYMRRARCGCWRDRGNPRVRLEVFESDCRFKSQIICLCRRHTYRSCCRRCAPRPGMPSTAWTGRPSRTCFGDVQSSCRLKKPNERAQWWTERTGIVLKCLDIIGPGQPGSAGCITVSALIGV